MRSIWFWLACLFGLIAVVWGGYFWVAEHRFRSEFKRAEREVALGRYRLAQKRLAKLTKQRPGSSEAAYQLGVCEEKLNNPRAALKAWSAVAAGSPHFIKAALGRSWALVNTGRLTAAEEVLASIKNGDAPDTMQLRNAREHLLRLEGRTQEARALIVQSWQGAPDPSHVLKRLYILEDAAFPLDYMKKTLERGDPQDDRVWLGQANLSIWQGRFEEAARSLDACLARRPDDQAVWLAELLLATQSRDAALARRAVEHLDAGWFLPFEVLRLRAWFAAFRGDDEAERAEFTCPDRRRARQHLSLVAARRAGAEGGPKLRRRYRFARSRREPVIFANAIRNSSCSMTAVTTPASWHVSPKNWGARSKREAGH